jgi:hypothetical protein
MLLGTDEGEVIAERIDRTGAAVWRQRFKLGFSRPIPGGERRRGTAAELALRETDDDELIAARIDRTHEAVRLKRDELGVPTRRDERLREFHQN